MATVTEPQRADRQQPSSSSRCPGTRSPGSWAAWASTPRSTSPTAQVAECYSTSSIFRGYSIFMKGKDPRDAHFITSRICGICGDNHATCSVYAQNMAFGVRPPHLGEWIINLGEAAEYMFDHNIFQENLVGVDFCEQMVKETNPGVWGKAERTEAPHAGRPRLPDHRRHHALAQPVRGRVLPRGAADEPADPGDVLPDGGAARPPLHALPGRRRHGRHGAALHRLPRPADAVRRVHEAGRAAARRPVRLLLRGPARLRGGRPAPGAAGLLGQLQRPRGLRLHLPEHEPTGAARCTSPPASSSTASWSPTTWSTSTSASASCSGSSYYDDWEDQEMFVTHDPLGNPVDRRHPWNQHTIPQPAEARLRRQVHLGHVAALVRRQATTWPSTPAAGRSPGSGPPRWPGWSTSATSRRPATASRSTCRRR